MFGVNHVYNTDYNTFMIIFFSRVSIFKHLCYNMNISTPANIDEVTFALLNITNYIIYLLGKKKKKKERRSNIKHNDDKSTILICHWDSTCTLVSWSAMTMSKHLFGRIQTLINHDGSKPHFHLFGYANHFKVVVDKLYSTQTIS